MYDFSKEKILIIFLAITLGYFARLEGWAVETPSSDKSKMFAISKGTTCISSVCHENIENKKYSQCDTANGYYCLLCHRLEKEGFHVFKEITETSEICMQCHDEWDSINMAKSGGHLNDVICSGCHNIHSSENPANLKVPLSQICTDCHIKDITNNKEQLLPSIKPFIENKDMITHKPPLADNCLSCHGSHFTDTFRALKGNYTENFYNTKFIEEAYGACLKCHNKFADALSGLHRVKNTGFRNGDINLHFKHVVQKKGRTCRSCHHHHGSLNQKLIRDNIVFGTKNIPMTFEITETGGNCLPACHVFAGYDREHPVSNKIIPVSEYNK